MPLYEYECDACGGRFEVIQKFSETTETCRRCGKGPVRRLLSPPAIQFKGTGWYITDYAQKGKSGGDTTAAGDPAEKKSDAAKAETSTKSDTAAPSAAPPTTSSKD
jgi:putative FmdB family regulatory protein